MAEYRLDVRPILEVIGGGVHAVDTLDLDDLHVGEETFVLREPASFDVMISNAGEGLVAIGSVTAKVSTTCVRCLCQFDTEIVGDVEGFWLRPGADVPEDQDVNGSVDSEGRIDIGPALEAALIVEAPFAPLHAEDCAGLCPTCGVDRNAESCSCAEVPSETNPFAVLRQLIDDDQSKE